LQVAGQGVSKSIFYKEKNNYISTMYWPYKMKTLNEKGTTLIEMVMILPLFLVIVFGIIEFSILLYDQAMITNASREGARAGIVYNLPDKITETEIRQIVRSYCEEHLISFGSGALDINFPSSPPGVLSVTVSYAFRFLVFSNVLALFGDEPENLLNLSATTVMRFE